MSERSELTPCIASVRIQYTMTLHRLVTCTSECLGLKECPVTVIDIDYS